MDKQKKLIKNKSVSFNIVNNDEKELYDYACEQINFSKFIKRLIDRELSRKKTFDTCRSYAHYDYVNKNIGLEEK